MSPLQVSFEVVDRELRRHTFGILGTMNRRGRPHSVGLIYAVSPRGLPLRLYAMTQDRTRKAKNIASNHNVSFVVPCPRRFLGMAPPGCIQFQGIADILPMGNPEATAAFIQTFLLRMLLDKATEIELPTEELGEPCYIRIRPDPVIHTYGVGLSAFGVV